MKKLSLILSFCLLTIASIAQQEHKVFDEYGPIKYGVNALSSGIPLFIKVDKQTKIQITGANRELVGQVAAKIRSFRPPEPYLGKGVKYSDEKIRRKAGKSAAK